MLMQVCPTGHGALILRHSLISTGGKRERESGQTRNAFPKPVPGWPKKSHPPLYKTTDRVTMTPHPRPLSSLLTGSPISPVHHT